MADDAGETLTASAHARMRAEVAAGRLPEDIDPRVVATYAARWRRRWPGIFGPLPLVLAAGSALVMQLVAQRIDWSVVALGFGLGLVGGAAQLTHGRNKLIRAERAARAAVEVEEGPGAAPGDDPPGQVHAVGTVAAICVALAVSVALFLAAGGAGGAGGAG